MLTTFHFRSFPSYSGSTLKKSSWLYGISSVSSKSISCVCWSSSSTKSSPSANLGYPAASNPFLCIANNPSMRNCVRFPTCPSYKIARSRSLIASRPSENSSVKKAPTCFTKATVTSTVSSVGYSNSKIAIYKGSPSDTTPWFARCPINVHAATHTGLSPRTNARLNYRVTRCNSSSPISGNLVLSTATKHAYVAENAGYATYAFIIALMSSPLPRVRFSFSNSYSTLRMFPAFTLLTMPWMLLRSASHVCRWYSSDVLSVNCARSMASLNGGM